MIQSNQPRRLPARACLPAVALLLAFTVTVAITRAQVTTGATRPTSATDESPSSSPENQPGAKTKFQSDATQTTQYPNATALEVKGTVQVADAGVSPLTDEGWHDIKANDGIPAGKQIRTGKRSSVTLRFGDTTYISIVTPTFAAIETFYKTATEETVRMGLGYGTIRGGSYESEVESNVVVDAPTATLAKRGTDGWQITVSPGAGAYEISLAREGLVEALQKVRSDERRSKLVRPGEYATNDNIATLWINQARYDRNINYVEPEWVSASDTAFSRDQTAGLAVNPGLGRDAWAYRYPNARQWTLNQIDRNFNEAAAGGSPPSMIILEATRRPEGNFGTRGSTDSPTGRTIIRRRILRR